MLREGRGNPNKCPRFTNHNEACRVVDAANLWARRSYMQVVMNDVPVHFSRIQWYCKSFKNIDWINVNMVHIVNSIRRGLFLNCNNPKDVSIGDHKEGMCAFCSLGNVYEMYFTLCVLLVAIMTMGSVQTLCITRVSALCTQSVCTDPLSL